MPKAKPQCGIIEGIPEYDLQLYRHWNCPYDMRAIAVCKRNKAPHRTTHMLNMLHAHALDPSQSRKA